MKQISLLALLIFCLNDVNGQMTILWEQQSTVNSSYNASVEQLTWDSENNIIIAGYSWYGSLNSNQTVFVAKLSTDGELIWMQSFMDQSIGDYDRGTVNGLYVDDNDNILLFAKFFSQKVIRYNKDGTLLSAADYKFGLPFTINIYNQRYLFDKVHRSPSNEFFLGGFYSDPYNNSIYSYLVEFDILGSVMRQNIDTLSFIQYSIYSSSMSLYESYSKLYFIGKASYGAYPNNTDGLQYSSMDMQGNIDWLEANWYTDYNRWPLKMLRNNEGNIYYTSYKESSSGSEDGSYLTKLSVDGEVLWERYFDGYSVTDFESDNDGNLIIIGSGRYENKTILAKFSASGHKAYEIVVDGNYSCSELVIDSNNNAYFAVTKSDGIFLVKYKWNGDKLDEIEIENSSNPIASLIILDENSDIIVCTDFNQNINIRKITDLATSVNEESSIPKIYSLSQNYPNPFNPATKINYSLPVSSKVSLVVYDILGIEIKTLVNEFQNAGRYTIDFNSVGLSSGVYFYRISADQFSETKKLILLK